MLDLLLNLVRGLMLKLASGLDYKGSNIGLIEFFICIHFFLI